MALSKKRTASIIIQYENHVKYFLIKTSIPQINKRLLKRLKRTSNKKIRKAFPVITIIKLTLGLYHTLREEALSSLAIIQLFLLKSVV